MLILVHITTVQKVARRNMQAHGIALGNPAMCSQQKVVVRAHQQARKCFQISEILIQEFPPTSQDFEVFTTKYVFYTTDKSSYIAVIKKSYSISHKNTIINFEKNCNNISIKANKF